MNGVKLSLLTAICIATAFTFFACEEKSKKADSGGEAAVQRVEAEAPKAAEAEASKPSDGSTFTDTRDGKTYKSVKIGKQTWMAENLNFKTENSWCYDNNEANCQKYGRLYNQKTAMKACPSGWHLPSKEDWDSLVEMAGGKEIAGKKLKSKTGWNEGNGIDEFGFSALPGGCRGCMPGPDDNFEMVGEIGYWWEMPHEYDGFRDMGSEDQFTGGSGANVYSVRCVKD